MTAFTFRLVNSLEKILPKESPRPLDRQHHLSGLTGEIISFQLAYTCDNESFDITDCFFHVKVLSPLSDHISIRKVDLVPCAYPCHGVWDENYLTTSPGLLPDLLTPIEIHKPIKAIPAQWRSLWFDVSIDEGLTAESYSIMLHTENRHGQLLWQDHIIIHPLQHALPKQKLLHTEWFHADCLADYYQVPVFSEEHWAIIDHFMASAASHGINMLLTPVFTPPLDTAIGGERTTVQLVDVNITGDHFEFDFSKLRRWIHLCSKHGIEQIEISHLFSQWGAEYAPKIIASVDGIEHKIFGWDTPATGIAYQAFLHIFIPQLKEVLKELQVFERTWFHLSDEPHDHQKTTYAAAKASVQSLLSDCKVIDALSSYDIYHEGIVEKPIPCVDQIQPFIDANVPHLWTYYCTAQAVQVPNRFIAMPSSRNRILGVLLYLYQIEGFLHWGFNFYNAQYSIQPINPYLITDAGEAFPSGDPFLVYPAPDGTAYESIRGMVLKEALYDLRALELLESFRGRSAVEELIYEGIEHKITFLNYPASADYLIQLRVKINESIRRYLYEGME